MNENTFKSQRNHTRVKFEPLSTSCSLVCITPQSPVAQSVNTTLSPIEYEPDRSATPTVVLPEVKAVDIDNIFHHGAANEYLSLSSIQWLVDGKDIASVWTQGTDYDIVTAEDDTRGALRIYKNLTAGEKSVLRFKGEFLDWRTGSVYAVESDELPLTCTDKGGNILSCHVDKPLIVYDPLYDDLLLYDYKVANGITVSGSRASHKDGKSFEQRANVVLTDGTKELATLPTGVTMQLVKLGGNTAITANSEANPEVTNIAYPNIDFDMRLIDKAEYEVQFVQNSKVVCRTTIGLNTSVSMPTSGKPLFNSDIIPAQTEYFNTVLVNLADRMVECPELYYLIVWYTQAKYNDNGTWKYATEKKWQRGQNMHADITELGIGVTQNDSYFDLWFDIDPHQTNALLTDGSNVVLTDENDNMLIG